nr:protein C11orf74 homolog isoform X2 [Geotrypetes seraphini]
MPVPLPGVLVDEDQVLQDTLSSFVNSHEQTYEEFFNSFTNICRDEMGPRTETSQKASVEGHRAPSWPAKADGEMSVPTDAVRSSLSDVPQALEEDQVEDFKSDERGDWKRITTAGIEPLPGEIEEEETCYHPSFAQCTQLQIRTEYLCTPESSTAPELGAQPPSDDVLSFSLDEGFDYDNVKLTPKFSETELKVMTEASRQQLLRTVESKLEEA